MKTRTPLFRIDRFLIAALALLAAPQVHAQLYYQTNGTNATWTTAVWNTTGSGTFNSAWVSGTNVIFGTASGGTNLVTFATATVGDITVNGNTTISSAGTLTWRTAGSTVTVADGVTLTWTSQNWSTTNAPSITKAGNGTWNIGAQGSQLAVGSSFTLNAGTVIVSGGNSFGGTNATLNINGGLISVSGARSFNNFSVVIGGNFGFTNTGSGTFNGGVSLGSSIRTITNSASGITTFNGIISNSGGLTLTGSGAGTITLSGANTYTGKTTVSGSTVLLSGSGRAGATNSDLDVTGGVLDLGTGTKTNAAFLISGGTITNGTLQATSYALQGGTIISNATLGTGTATVATGTTTLNGLLNATTVNVNSGTLNLGAADRLANGAAVTIAGGTLGMGANNDQVSTFAITGGTLGGSGTLTATTYALGGGTVAANLGTGTINASANTALNGTATATTVNVTAGTLTLGNAGRLTGTTPTVNISGGTLATAGNESVGTLNLTNGTLSGSGTFTASNYNVQAGTISAALGTGTITKSTAGTVTISGASTASGSVAINAGLLNFTANNQNRTVTVNSTGTIGGTGSLGATTINSGGTLSPGTSPGSQTYSSLTWEGGGNYNWQLYDANAAAGTGYDTFVSTGAFTINASSGSKFNINLWTLSGIGPDTNGSAINFNSSTSYSWTLGTFGSISGFAADAFNINTGATNGTAGFANLFAGTLSLTTNATQLLLVYTAPVLSSVYTWNSGDGLWSVGGNWADGNTPTNSSSLVFAGASGGVSTNDNTLNDVSNVTFSNTAGSYTLTGSAFTNGVMGIVNNSSNAQTINNDLVLGAAQAFNAASGDLNFGGAVNNNGNLLIVSGASNTVMSGAISGSGGLTKSGNGSLTLGGNNTFTGALTANGGTTLLNGTQDTTTVNVGGGTLLLGGNNRLADGATLALSSGTVNFGGFSDTVTTFNISGGVFTNGIATATTYGLSGGTVGGALSGGTANVTGGVSLSGTIASTLNINTGGTLTLAANDRIDSGSAVTINAGTLATATFNDTIGSLVLTNGGSITGSGTITAGTYTLNGGTVTGNLGAGTATSSAGTTTLNGALGATTVNVNTGGTVNLGSANRLDDAAAVTIGGGTLGIGNVNDTVGSFTITSGTLGGTNGVLTASTYALQGGTINALLGAGAITVTSGTTTLGSAGRLNSASTLTINSGQLSLGGAETVASLSGAGGTLALGGSGLTFGGNNADSTFSGVISSTGGGITKAGSGTVVFSGNNSYTGATAVSAGALRLASATASGSTAGGISVTSGAALELSGGIAVGAEALSLAGSGISSGGALRSVSGSNSYAGVITNTGAVTIAADTGSTMTISGSINLNTATMTVGGAGNTFMSGTVTNGSVTKAGNGTVTFSNTATSLGTLTTGTGETAFATNARITGLAGPGALNLVGGTLTLTNTTAQTFSGAITGAGGFTKTGAETLTLSGSGSYSGPTTIAIGTILVAANNALSTNSAVTVGVSLAPIGTSRGQLSISDGFSQAIAGLTLFGGATNTNSGRVIIGAGSTLTVNGNITYENANTGSYPSTISGGTLDLGGTNRTITVWTNGNSTLGGDLGIDSVIANGSIVKEQSGILRLSGANTFAGTFSNNAGVLWISNANALQNATLDVGADSTARTVSFIIPTATTYNIGALTGGDALAISNNTLSVGANNVSTDFAGAITGTSGRLFKVGTGTMTLTGANGYTGGTLVSAGRLIGDTRSLQGTITNNSAITFSQTTNGTYSSAMAGGGSLTKLGSGTVTFSSTIAAGTIDVGEGTMTNSSANRFTGTPIVTVSNGATLSLAGSETLGSLAGAGAVSIATDTLTVGGSGASTTFDGVLSGAGALTKTGAGTFTLTSGSNVYSGGTTINGGAVEVTGANRLGALSGALTINNGKLLVSGGLSSGRAIVLGNANSTIEVSNGVTYTATNTSVVSGSGTLNKTGDGVLALFGTNTYTGGTLVSAGTLAGNTAGLIGPITNNAAVVFSMADNGTYGSVISGNGTLAKSGAGTLTMTNANTFSGATTVSGGRLLVNGTNANSAVTVNSSASLGGSGQVGALTVNGLVAPGNSIGTLSAGNTAFNGGGAFELEIFNFAGSAGSDWDQLIVGGSLTLNNTTGSPFSINLVSMSSPTTTGTALFNANLSYTNTFLTYSSLVGGFDASAFLINTNSFANALNGSFSITNTGTGLALLYTTSYIPPSVFEWSTGSGDWSDNNAWAGSVAPTDGADIAFTGGGGQSTNTTVGSIVGLTFSNGAGSYTISGGTMTNGTGGIVNNSANTQTVSNNLVLGAAQSFSSSGGDLVIAGNVDNNGNVLTLAGVSNVVVSGVISNTGGITKIGAGTATLAGNNTYSGSLGVNTGTVLVSGTQATATINVGGGTLLLGADNVLANGATLSLNSGAVNLGGFSDTISTYSQVAGTITNGSLAATTYNLTGGTMGAGLNGGTVNVSGAVSLSGTITNGASVNITNGGTLTFADNDRIGTGITVGVNGGTLNLGGFSDTIGVYNQVAGTITNGSLAATTYNLTGGTMGAGLNGGTVNVGGAVSLSGTITNGASVNITNGGTLTLAAADRIDNGLTVTVNGGTLNLGTFSDTISVYNQVAGTITNGSLAATTFNLDGGTIGSNANLTNGTTANVTNGTVTLDGTLATATLNINGGTLGLGSNGRIDNNTGVFLSSGTLNMGVFSDGVGSFTMTGGTVAGTGTLSAVAGGFNLQGGTINANLGSGTITVSGGTTDLNGSSTSTTVNVNSGTLNLGASDRLANTAAVTLNGGTLGMSNFTDTVGTFTITGGTLGGSGTLTAGGYALQGGTINANLGTGAATNSAGTTTVNGNLGGALTASGGTNNLNGTVAGNVSVSGGTVNLGSADRIANSSSVTVSSGALNLNGNDFVSAVQITGGSIAGSGVLTATSNYDVQGGAISAALGGSAAMTKSGATTATLSGNNSGYSGAISVGNGTLLAGSDNALGSGAITVTNGSVLATGGRTIANGFTIGSPSSVNAGTNVFVAGWDFQSTNNGGTAAAATPNSPTLYRANFGRLGSNAVIYLNGTNGSSAWTSSQITAFGGSSLNTKDGMSTTTTGDSSLAVVNPSGSSANGQRIVFTLDMTDLATLDLSYASRYSGTTAFNNHLWEFSSDGSTWTGFYTNTGLTTSFAVYSNASSITALSNSATAYLRLTISGATASGGNNRLDNIQLNALSIGTTNAPTGSGTLGISEAGTATFSGNIVNNNAATFTAASGGSATFSGAISGAGSLNKTGAGTVTLSGASANTFTGTTTVSAGTLELNKTASVAALASTNIIVSKIDNNNRATLLISANNQVANTTAITLSGGTITRGSGVSEVFGNLNLTEASFLDFGTGDTGNLAFGTYTSSALLTVQNFLPGNKLQFATGFDANLLPTGGNLSNANFSFSNGFTTGTEGGYFTITAIPEPSTYLAAAGLLGLMLWPSRKRIIRDTKKILGLRAPMRDRLAAKRI